MAHVRAFRPLRFASSSPSTAADWLAARVAPPYDVIDSRLRETLLASDPHNVVQLDLPVGEGDGKYAEAAGLLRSWQEQGVLQRDETPAFYTYEQRFTSPVDGGERRRRGFFAAVRLEPYDANVVLPHERTLRGPKEDRRKLLEATRTATSPGFLLFRGHGELEKLAAASEPLAEFSTPDGIRHALGRVVDAEVIAAVQGSLAHAELLIADGHHRYETALHYAQTRGEEGEAASRFGLFYLVDENDPELLVLPTHRVVHSLPDFDAAALHAELGALFELQELDRGLDAAGVLSALAEAGKGAPSLVIEVGGAQGFRTLATLRAGVDLGTHPVLRARSVSLRSLDVVLVHDAVIEHLLNVSREAQAAKTNLRYVQDAGKALAEVAGGQGQVAILLNATPVAQVRHAAEAGEVMPQKSTFFFPKVPTGLAFLPLEGAL